MILLVLGVLLWSAVHSFKRFAPEARARLGDKGKALVALGVVAGLVLIVTGFRSADFVEVYQPQSWARHLNNLLMLVAVALMGLGKSKSRLRAAIRHPMLSGVIVWGVAHLLVNGDLASLVLFGSMIVWAFVEMRLINASELRGARYKDGSKAGDIRLAAITVAVFAVITSIHTWLGYWPFPG
ncbi:NnrU family protein [Candidatus Halocynthiibacter alkanivorans]|jgi:uncharacterized membrane protein|uniref:NnrU family protein n=1 Tax=Candidatus Halocynthiibacter alkanivorans TaxID=2267619 RepID=UPI000DF210B1|nr:NnrU family protein [Candidatus Halocynthiibacter alkanivorans]